MSDDKQQQDSPEKSGFNFDPGDMEDGEVQKLHAQIEREHDEPQEGLAVTPMAIVFLAMMLCLWAGYELANSSGGFRWDVYNPGYRPDGGGAEAAAFDPIARGRRIYNNCVACHMADGTGVPGIFPPLAGADWVGKPTDILARIVIVGVSGEMVVNGNTYNGHMSGFSNLSDRDVASVISYIRNAWGNEYSIMDEAEVAAVRAEIGARTSPYSAQELLDLIGQ